MTISTTTNRNVHSGNGSATSFAYEFYILDASHLKVYLLISGVLELQNSGYTVNNVGNPLGGTVDFTVAPASGSSNVVLKRVVPFTQLVDYVANDAFPEETHEEALDKLTMLTQFLYDEVARSPRFPINSNLTDFELPTPSARKGLMWNDTEDGITNTTIDMDEAADQAAASAASASTSATNAANSASAANTSATNAATSATNASNSATAAAASASAASTSATNAATSATAAQTAETNAETALTDALAIYGSIAAVQTAATNASNSASAAATSATNAATSATNAAASEATVAADAAAAAASATAASGSVTTAAGHASAASASASAAATSANSASSSADSANTSEAAAGSSATNAANSAAAAAASATTAGNSATSAATSATTATSMANAASASATSAAEDAAAAAISDTNATNAWTSAAALYGDLAAVSNAVVTSTTQANLALGYASSAQNSAASAAASALSAASVVSQDLSAIDRTVFAATIVDAFIYDTEKDSDGGAWRKRCAHTSWENETLSGNWLGSAANEAAARAISGATTGSYYYDTTAAGFYTLNAGSGKTATYRGNVRQFPAKVLITVEAARVVLWDLTQAGVPMWMVITATNFALESTATCTAAINANLGIGCNGYDLYVVNFIQDISTEYTTISRNVRGRISDRVSGNQVYSVDTSAVIVSRFINDVAMTVLPNAPVDVATGLPVPTIAVATDGNATYSTSVIMNDGSVVNIASDSTGTAVGVEFDGLALKVIRSDGTVYYWNDVRALTTGASPSATVSASTTPAALGTASKQARRALSSSTGLTLMRRNQLTLASSMLAYITKDYASGWMVGDIRGAWLADTVAETLTGAELVTNGTFTTDISGWTNSSAAGGTISWNAAGKMDLTYTTGVAIAVQVLTLVVGKTYTLSMDKTGTGTFLVRAGLGTGESQALNTSNTVSTFVATHAAQYITIYNTSAGTLTLDNITCRLADVDRSVKAKGLQAFGSLTKAAVASGAALMGYSGFSAANYLEQPYNADLDFGTGDFCIMGWLIEQPNSTNEIVFMRAAYSGGWSGAGIQFYIASTGVLAFQISDDGFATVDVINSTAAVDDGTPRLLTVCRRGAYIELWINGAKGGADVAVANAAGSLSNASATLMLGRQQDTSTEYPLTNGTLALWRASATAPSAEQIKHIYETEKALFEANAQCCLAGTSNAVTALAYDDETDLLHVGTSYGRSAFKGLVRVSSEATPVGAITALAASGGFIAQGGASGADIYVPAYLLREELNRAAEQKKAFGQALVAHDFTATASQTTFTLPVGWEIVAVYQQGSIKRETTSWTRSFDGFKWSAVLGTGATVSDWISILAKRV